MPSTRFSTALGGCAITWNDHGLTAFNLPGDRPSAPNSTGGAAPDLAPPSDIAALIVRIQHHLSGNLQDFADARYDWSCVTAFQEKVLRALLTIGPGHTNTYGGLAQMIGAKPGASRAIGGAVGANPWPLLVPCHRILSSTGKLTGYSGPGGLVTKARLLAIEGVELRAQ